MTDEPDESSRNLVDLFFQLSKWGLPMVGSTSTFPEGALGCRQEQVLLFLSQFPHLTVYLIAFFIPMRNSLFSHRTVTVEGDFSRVNSISRFEYQRRNRTVEAFLLAVKIKASTAEGGRRKICVLCVLPSA